MKILCLDTEYENSPRRLISIAYIIADNNEIIDTKNILIKHNINIFQIDEQGIAFSKHNITNKQCQNKGSDIDEVLKIFSEDLDKVDCVIGHNLLTADISTIRREAIGKNLWKTIFNKLKSKKLYDTLKESKKKFSDIESYSLDKIYKQIFQKDFLNHHDALEDCKTTFEIFKYFQQEIGENNFDLLEMNFPENEIENTIQKIKLCSHCNKNVKNYYITKNTDCPGKYRKYKFVPYSVYTMENGNILCTKCYDNIEIIKYYENEMVDILNKNMNKNTFKYNSEFLESKKFCFEYIENKKKINKIYLNCPYEQRELCKNKGGKWDAKIKKWYITNELCKDEFNQWLN